MKKQPIQKYLEKGRLLFDGAMGSYYVAQEKSPLSPCELACLQEPEKVRAIHEAYLSAGARAIKTNTFAANTAALQGGMEQVYAVIDAAFSIASDAARAHGAYVFADIGPLPSQNPEREYALIAERFLSLGADCFLFETFDSFEHLEGVFAQIKGQNPDAFILCSFAVSPDGFSAKGLTASSLLLEAQGCDFVDAVGLNCVCGPFHLLQIARGLTGIEKPLSIMPNAGSPQIMSGRTYFPANPFYFADQMAEIALYAPILGGCCGTDPDYIRAVSQAVSARRDVVPVMQRQAAGAPQRANPFIEKLKSGQKVIAVELDPPANTKIQSFLRGAKALKAADVDIITIADCPIARVRADACMLAAKLKRELQIESIPHMTCRDRNLNAAKALLLGLGIEGISNVLAVTGDPVPTADREVKGVFNFSSVTLARYIAELSEQTGNPIAVSAALNVNVQNFDAELQKALRKQAAGVACLFTQPVYSKSAIENIRRAKEELDIPILAGIMPVVSHKNALYLKNEVQGFEWDDMQIARFESLGREEAEKLSLSICRGIIDAVSGFVSGFYLITPFGRVSMITQLMEYIRRA